MRFPNWLWPRTPISDPGPIVRLGRVVHWALTGVSALFLALATAFFLLAAFPSAAFAQDDWEADHQLRDIKRGIEDIRQQQQDAEWRTDRRQRWDEFERDAAIAPIAMPTPVPPLRALTKEEIDRFDTRSSIARIRDELAYSLGAPHTFSIDEAYGRTINPVRRRAEQLANGLLALASALALFLLGRAIRYVVANE
jgi:hypothetical protein